MDKKSFRCAFAVFSIWFFFLFFFVLRLITEGFNYSPWGAHTFQSIIIQFLIIFLPLAGVVLSFSIRPKVLKFMLIFGNLFLTYYFSYPSVMAWLAYFEGN